MSTTDFRPLVNHKFTYNIRKIVGIVQTFSKKYEKGYLLFKYEFPDVGSLEYSTWTVNVQNTINNDC